MGYSSVKTQAQGIATDEFDENSPEAKQKEIDRLTRLVSKAYADPNPHEKRYKIGNDFQIGKFIYQKGTVYTGQKWIDLVDGRQAPNLWLVLSETEDALTES